MFKLYILMYQGSRRYISSINIISNGATSLPPLLS
jgi:hypothetical protein